MDNNNFNQNSFENGSNIEQAVYGTESVVYDVPATKKTNVPGILSFIFSLVSAVLGLIACCSIGSATLFSWIPFLNVVVVAAAACVNIGGFLIVPLALAGVILGIVGVTRKDKSKGLAIAGLIISALVLLIGLVLGVLLVLSILGLGTIGFAEYLQYLNY